MVATEDGLNPKLREALRIPRIAQTDDVSHQDVVVGQKHEAWGVGGVVTEAIDPCPGLAIVLRATDAQTFIVVNVAQVLPRHVCATRRDNVAVLHSQQGNLRDAVPLGHAGVLAPSASAIVAEPDEGLLVARRRPVPAAFPVVSGLDEMLPLAGRGVRIDEDWVPRVPRLPIGRRRDEEWALPSVAIVLAEPPSTSD